MPRVPLTRKDIIHSSLKNISIYMVWWPKSFGFVFCRVVTVNCCSNSNQSSGMIQLYMWDISRLESHSTKMCVTFGQKLQNCLNIHQLHVKYYYYYKSNKKKNVKLWEKLRLGPYNCGGIKNATISGHFGFAFEKKNSGREIILLG